MGSSGSFTLSRRSEELPSRASTPSDTRRRVAGSSFHLQAPKSSSVEVHRAVAPKSYDSTHLSASNPEGPSTQRQLPEFTSLEIHTPSQDPNPPSEESESGLGQKVGPRWLQTFKKSAQRSEDRDDVLHPALSRWNPSICNPNAPKFRRTQDICAADLQIPRVSSMESSRHRLRRVEGAYEPSPRPRKLFSIPPLLKKQKTEVLRSVGPKELGVPLREPPWIPRNTNVAPKNNVGDANSHGTLWTATRFYTFMTSPEGKITTMKTPVCCPEDAEP